MWFVKFSWATLGVVTTLKESKNSTARWSQSFHWRTFLQNSWNSAFPRSKIIKKIFYWNYQVDIQVLGLPRGFRPLENFWISLLDTQFGDQMREVCFKFVKCSYRLPTNIDLIKNSLPVKLTLIEVDWSDLYQCQSILECNSNQCGLGKWVTLINIKTSPKLSILFRKTQKYHIFIIVKCLRISTVCIKCQINKKLFRESF